MLNNKVMLPAKYIDALHNIYKIIQGDAWSIANTYDIITFTFYIWMNYNWKKYKLKREENNLR